MCHAEILREERVVEGVLGRQCQLRRHLTARGSAPRKFLVVGPYQPRKIVRIEIGTELIDRRSR